MPSGSSGGSGGGARGGSFGGSSGGNSGGSGSGASSGSGGRATVFDSGEGGASVQPKGIIDAVEDIQRLYVLESRADQDLPYDFFSFKQVLDFAWIGFRGAIVESLLFFLIFPLALTIYPAAKLYFTGAVPTLGDYILPFVLSYSTIIIMTVYVMSAARYYKGGTVTRKAIHSLFTGRSAAFAIKACLGWFLLIQLYIQSYNHPEWIWSFLDVCSFVWNIFLIDNVAIDTDLLYAFWFQAVAPALKDTAGDIFATMLILAAIPFCTLFAYGGYKYLNKRSQRRQLEQY
jgi:hypothetical protein